MGFTVDISWLEVPGDEHGIPSVCWTPLLVSDICVYHVHAMSRSVIIGSQQLLFLVLSVKPCYIIQPVFNVALDGLFSPESQ
jgi:hypothetical protein